jgi:hypothetical protein
MTRHFGRRGGPKVLKEVLPAVAYCLANAIPFLIEIKSIYPAWSRFTADASGLSQSGDRPCGKAPKSRRNGLDRLDLAQSLCPSPSVEWISAI